MTNRRDFLLAFGAALATPSWVLANPGALTASDALAKLNLGSLILIDIRTPEEWHATGVAQGAWPLDMTQRTFGAKLIRAIESNPNHDIAVICRTGRRSAYLVEVLAKNDITGVLDVSEGMAGGRNGTGWIPSGLPIVTAKEALAAMPADLVVK